MIDMHLRKRHFVFLFAVLGIVLSTAIMAANVDIGLKPASYVQGENTEFSLAVTNNKASAINRVELNLPQIDTSPIFIAKQITAPAEWTFETRYTVGASSPFQIAWSTAGAGIETGKSLTFKVVLSSNDQGSFPFSWKTSDFQGGIDSGEIQVKSVQQAFSNLQVAMPNSAVAGTPFDLTISAIDASGNRKVDYVGTVSFSSTDIYAILPPSYEFKPSDGGSKIFKVKLKTAGEHEMTVKADDIVKTMKVKVVPAEIVDVDFYATPSTVTPKEIVAMAVIAHDVYNNSWDVTTSSTFEIDKEAKGTFANNTYKSEVEGNWTLTASYMAGPKKFSGGHLLMVSTRPIQPEPEPEPEEREPQAPIEASAEIIVDDVIQVQVNSTKSFNINVENTGEVDLGNVSIVFSGFPENLMNVSPSLVNIGKDRTQRFTATVFVAEKMDPAEVQFLVVSKDLSSDVFSAQKIVKLNFTEAAVAENPTGAFTLSRNLTYLGVAIVVAIALIILFWFLFLREEPKKKKVES